MYNFKIKIIEFYEQTKLVENDCQNNIKMCSTTI